MPKQHRLVIDTRYSETTPVGLAVKYLNSREVRLRDALEVAISCYYAPLAAAIEGATQEEVMAYIERSRTQFEVNCGLALSRCTPGVRKEKHYPENNQETNLFQEDEDEEELIDFDSEDYEDG